MDPPIVALLQFPLSGIGAKVWECERGSKRQYRALLCQAGPQGQKRMLDALVRGIRSAA